MPEPAEVNSLKYRTLLMLTSSSQTDREVAKAIGVSTPWVRLFRQGDIQAPNVDTIQRLYEYLAGRPLFGGQ